MLNKYEWPFLQRPNSEIEYFLVNNFDAISESKLGKLFFTKGQKFTKKGRERKSVLPPSLELWGKNHQYQHRKLGLSKIEC